LSANKTYKFSGVGIDAKAYAQRFYREPHPLLDLKDSNKDYFSLEERLTTAELKLIESWPSTVSELFEHNQSVEAKDHFLRCIRSAIEPETSTERIVSKLIHQALAMGGLHLQKSYPPIPDSQPPNDINNLKALPLRSFLLGVQKEMAKYANKEFEQSTLEEFESYQHDLNGGYREMQEAQAEISKELYSYADDYVRSDDEGWFYDDDED